MEDAKAVTSRSRARKTRPRKRKFHGNRFTQLKAQKVNEDVDASTSRSSGIVEPEVGVELEVKSASFLKLGENVGLDLDSGDERETRSTSQGVDSEGYRLFQKLQIVSCLQNLACPVCLLTPDKGDPFHIEEKLVGISSTIIVRCKGCGEKVTELSQTENVNLRFQAALYGIGCHMTKGRRLLAALDMPPPVSVTRSSIFRDRIRLATETIAKESMERAADELRKVEGDNVTVSCDGSWQRRGFSSKNGLATCLTVSKKVPAKVIDTEVLTNYCDGCSKIKARKTGKDLENGMENHAKDCRKNYSGSAGGMEPAGMVKIFRRSEELYGMRYTGYLGDGDSKSFRTVAEADPPVYKDVGIQKLECCGHVQKRMGKRLLDKINQCKGKVYQHGNKKVKGIGGAGKLTKAAVKRIQGHYGGAIRNNIGSLDKMKTAIWAIWHHRNGDHDKCSGFSWCDKSDKNKLPSFVMEEIKSVFEDLSADTLLGKCLHGGTQNANESYHHLVWDRCPKAVFVGRDRLEIAVFDATIVYNEGGSGRLDVFRKLGLSVGRFQKQGFRDLDLRRVKSAENQEKTVTKQKRARKTIRNAEEDFGDDDYEAGAF